MRPRQVLLLALALAIGAACTSGPTGTSPASAPSSSATGTPTAAGSATPSVVATTTATPAPTPTVAPTAKPVLRLISSAFAAGAAIPARYTCSGAGTSPPLGWSGVPAGTAALALIVDDTDAGGFVHWVVTDIPADLHGLAAGQRAGTAGRNSFGGVGYGGPCPPVGSGAHHYVFTLYALSHRLGLSGVPTATQVRAAAAKVTVATARLTGTFRR
ncbi:MAG TPA: YbhB/YbcL family Raf kinase inhibitor-like protein [Candidatus Sulfotelmatobacter sp.]|nr:YbhB/YbcL family Raf kinase inhibitor-like protein [Candidatus Sulfotelmatobacter sp.]